MVGFITGLGIEVFTNQLRRILGASNEHGAQLTAYADQLKESIGGSIETKGFFVEVLALLESVPYANWYSVAIGLGALAIVRLCKSYAPKIPGALAALIVTTVVVAVFDLERKGVSALGTLPSGLPSFTWPNIPPADFLQLVPGAFAIVAITLCEGLLLVRRYSRKHGYKADGNQVLFAYGVRQRGGRVYRVTGHWQQPITQCGHGSFRIAQPVSELDRGGRHCLGHALFHRHTRVSSQRRSGWDRGQCRPFTN